MIFKFMHYTVEWPKSLYYVTAYILSWYRNTQAPLIINSLTDICICRSPSFQIDFVYHNFVPKETKHFLVVNDYTGTVFKS